MIERCSIDKCPFRYEKVTVCSYYFDGICEIMSDEIETSCPYEGDPDCSKCDYCSNDRCCYDEINEYYDNLDKNNR